MLTVLVDYDSGNLHSAEKAFQRMAVEVGGGDILVTSKPEDVARADRIVLPGVGAFASCMAALTEREGVIEAMNHAVHDRGVPFLGICVGQQLMASRGLEFGVTPGLGWIDGDVRRIEPSDPHLKIPHMGWNNLLDVSDLPVLSGLKAGAPVYFTHSFAIFPSDDADVAAWVDHGGRFPAAVARGNLAGVQFHPEKSQSAGLKLLSDFLEWRP